MGSTKKILDMEVQAKQNVPHAKGVLKEKGESSQVHSYDSMVGEIKELNFLLRQS